MLDFKLAKVHIFSEHNILCKTFFLETHSRTSTSLQGYRFNMIVSANSSILMPPKFPEDINR